MRYNGRSDGYYKVVRFVFFFIIDNLKKNGWVKTILFKEKKFLIDTILVWIMKEI